ncbi:S8 family serine peptidase [Shewanella chilikensis]|uniref:S8 family serine peptidase n=1 Tax=Shewanella chilikensis TaxID=558541 RepID=UPI00200C67F0|nr:S8 family serine peptidase [Shewanella chilikensis]MCL1164035.1 S8 family serine peptidase [Shewanella chilikensis]
MKKISVFQGVMGLPLLLLATSALANSQVIVKWNDISELNSVEDNSLVNGVLVKKFEKSTFGGYSVLVADDSEIDVNAIIKLLQESGLFSYVVEDKKVSIEKPQSTNLVTGTPTKSSKKSKTPITYSIDLNKYKDPLVEKEFYHDVQKAFANGATSAFDAMTVFENNLGKKARVAIIDSGYFPHEDMVTPGEQARFVRAESYYVSSGNYTYKNAVDCTTKDPNNSGLDSVCPASNIVEITEQSNNALDKSWKPSKFEYDAEKGENVPVEYEVCVNGHGLSVAGTIAAIQNNGKGVSSAIGSDYVEIVPVKVIDSCSNDAWSSDIIKAIYWASESDDVFEGVTKISSAVDVINLSLGSSKPEICESGYNLLADAVKYANEKGIVVVASLGNEGIAGETFTPATCHGIIPVAANDSFGQLTDFSNFLSEQKTVSAVGQKIITPTINTYIYKAPENYSSYCQGETKTCYAQKDGTSFSAPIVSGLVALVKMQNPSLNPDEIFDVIYNSGNEFHESEVGSVTSMFKKSPNNRIVNFKNALMAANYDVHVGEKSVTQLMGNVTANYANDMISKYGKEKVCSTYKLDWSDIYQSNSHDVTFEVYGNNIAGSMTDANSTLIETEDMSPRTENSMVITKQYANYGVRVCKGNNCSAIEPFSFSSAEVNSSCL